MSGVEQSGGAVGGAGGVERVGNHERETAVAALQHHVAAGRLTSTEYEDRSVAARDARTWADLEALFTDLPAPGAAEIRANHVDEVRPAAGEVRPVAQEPAARPKHTGWLPEHVAHTVTALTPIAAVALFFWTGSWLWFLAIPVVAILANGPDGDPRKQNRDRNRRRGR